MKNGWAAGRDQEGAHKSNACEKAGRQHIIQEDHGYQVAGILLPRSDGVKECNNSVRSRFGGREAK